MSNNTIDLLTEKITNNDAIMSGLSIYDEEYYHYENLNSELLEVRGVLSEELNGVNVSKLMESYKRSEIQDAMGFNHHDREQNKGIMMGIAYTLKMLDRYDILAKLGVKYD